MHILYARERKSLNALIVVCGAIFDFRFICTFVINIFQKIVKSYELLPGVCDSYIKETG